VVGGLWTLWFQQLATLTGSSPAGQRPAAASGTTQMAGRKRAHSEDQPSLLIPTPPPDVEGSRGGLDWSIGAVFRRVSSLYNRRESYDLKNRVMAEWQVEPGDALDGAITGLNKALGLGSGGAGASSAADKLVDSGGGGGGGGEQQQGITLDYGALDALARRFRITERRNCVRCKVWGRSSHGLLCSGCESRWEVSGPLRPFWRPF
jgi:hypothetical protein